jgi:hypothetical membrane protein
MNTVRSADGTTIAYDRAGQGPPPVRYSTYAASLLLVCGILAGPVFLVAALIEGVTRTGFSFARNAISLLSLGSMGWIQDVNFMVTGVLAALCAAGIRRTLSGGPGGTWAPLLVGAFGIATIVAGVSHPDPSNGFPPGTPPGNAAHMSAHGAGHLISATLGFACLAAAAFVLARQFSRTGQHNWAIYSRASGALAVVGVFAAAASVLVFLGGIVIAFTWLAATSAHLRHLGSPHTPAAVVAGQAAR